MTPKIAIITAVYNNYKDIWDFLKSLQKQTDKNYHLFITDSSDQKKEIDTKGVPTTITNVRNKGYAAAINRGLEKAVDRGYEYFCVINDDTFFERNFIRNLRVSLKKHERSLIGGKIYYAPEYEYHKDRYQKKDLGNVIWYAGGSINWDHIFTNHRGVDEVDHGQYDREMETEFITGCLMFFDKKVLDAIGYWDETYFLYFEDTDFGERAKRLKIPLLYDPSVKIWHKVSQSTGGSGSLIHQKYQGKNRVKFGIHYAPLRTKFHLIKNYAIKKLINKG